MDVRSCVTRGRGVGGYVRGVLLALGAVAVLSIPTARAAPHAQGSKDFADWQAAQLPAVATTSNQAIEDFQGLLYVAVTPVDDAAPTSAIVINATDAAGQLQRAWTPIPGLASASGPALKVFQDQLYVAARGSDNRVYLAASRDGRSWGAWRAVPHSVATDAPALKVFQRRLYVAARTAAGQIAVTATADGASWQPWQPIPASDTPYQPALTQFHKKLTLAVTRADGSVALLTSADGQRWRTVPVPTFGLGGENRDVPLGTDAAPGVTVTPDRLYLAARVEDYDSEGGPRIASYDGQTWSDWDDTGRSSEGAPVLTTFGGRIYLVSRAWDATNLELFFRAIPNTQ